MAELTTFPEEHVREVHTYQRLSLLALGSLLIALPFTAILAVYAAWCLRGKEPIIMPPLAQMIPIVAIVMALVALVLIRRSDGVLAGRRVALTALWICVLVSLAYWAYFAATYLAVRQQSDVFVQAWMHKMADGKLIPAFLDTLPPASRQIDADDTEAIEIRFNQPSQVEKKGPLDSFRELEMIRTCLQGGPDIRIVPLGVRSWEYKNRAFNINRAYQVSTPEITLNVDVQSVGTVSRTHEFQGRGWQVVGGRGITVTSRELTERGQNLQKVIAAAALFMQKWWEDFGKGHQVDAYLATKEQSKRQGLRATYLGGLLLSGLAAGAAPPVAVPEIYAARWLPAFNNTLSRNLFLPGFYEAFSQLGIFKSDKVKTDSPKMKDTIISGLHKLMGEGTHGTLGVAEPRPEGLSARDNCKLDNGKAVIPLDCVFGVARSPTDGVVAQAVVKVEGPDKAAADGSSDSASWRVLQVELIRGDDLAKEMQRRVRTGGMR
jgi:hypothetical protein